MTKDDGRFWHKGLLKCKLFHSLEKKEIERLISILQLQSKECNNGDIVVKQGVVVEEIYIILEGKVNLVREDVASEKTIVKKFEKTQEFMFEEAAFNGESFFGATAAADNTMLLGVNYKQILYNEMLPKEIRNIITKNLFDMLSHEAIEQRKQIMYIHKKSTKEKIWSYLLDNFEQQEDTDIMTKGKVKGIFTVPHNRVEMAHYLGVDRAAMSRELSRLREQGLIEYYKNFFKFTFVD